MREVTVAATQMACDWDRDRNVARAEALVREAAGRGATIVLLQELFEKPYFCKDQSAKHFGLAQPIEGHPLVARMSRLAAELGVVLPVSFFERANNAYFNSVAMIDADGRVLGLYRKSHIPHGAGLPGEVLLQSRRYRLSRLADQGRLHRRRHLLGPVVPRGGAGHGADGRRDPALPDRDRLRARAAGLRQLRATGSG